MPAQITALPTPPSTNDPANFNTRADAFLGQLPTFVTQANALAGEVNANTTQVAADRVQTGADRTAAAASAVSALSAPGTNGASATSLAVGTGTKTFTTQAGKAWVAGQGFFLASSASPTNWMTGVLTAYNTSTGAATVQVDTIGGSGMFAAWNCGLSAGRPLPVATQAQAEVGVDGGTWMTPERTAQAAPIHAYPVGTAVQAAANPGTRWLPCTGLLYAITSYPALASVLPPYVNPMVLRASIYQSGLVAYGAGLFLAWAYNASAWITLTSPDGVTWTQRANPFGAGALPNKLVFANGLFLACSHTTAFSSVDGISWTARAHPLGATSQDLYSLTRSGSFWMASGRSNDAPYLATSPDGVTWTQKSNPGGQYISASAYNATLSRWFVSSGWSANWISDDNGATWQSVTAPTGYNFSQVVGGGNRFVAYSNSTVFSSPTGADGFGQGTNLGFSVQSLIFDGAQFLAAGSGGGLASSTDGVSWKVLATGLASTDWIVGVARASGALTSPIVISVQNAGLRSGLDVSTTQFQTPAVTGWGTGLSPYIKAL